MTVVFDALGNILAMLYGWFLDYPYIPASLPLLVGAVSFALNPRLVKLLIRNLGRNKVRTILNGLAIVFLVFMVTLIITVVFFLAEVTREKEADFKLIVTERWQLPSQMPMTYADYLNPQSSKFILDRRDVGPDDFMFWSFYGGSTDPNKITINTLVFFFAMDPDHIRSMMDDLDNLDPALVRKLKANRQGCLLGREKLRAIDKQVGERFKLTSINYRGVDLDFEVVGVLPEGRYDNSGIMNADYFNNALDRYKGPDGKAHPLSSQRLNLIWLRVKDKEAFERVAHTIESASIFTTPQVKCETASSGIGAFLDAYKDLVWGMKWLVVPFILTIMSLVVAMTISISVRERIKEIAVMKVLGYRPGQILILILGESMLVGGLSGLAAAGFAFVLLNHVMGGIKFPIAFFPAFFIPRSALWWGLAIGFGTSFLGSFLPALTARSVKVSEVFSKVT
jgi:putative ABC transport system permease protein